MTYCVLCGTQRDQNGRCPNCTEVCMTMEQVEREYPEFISKIPEKYRNYLAKDVRE